MAYTSESNQILVDKVKQSDFTELRITRIESQEHEFEAVDIRQWYCTQKDPEMKPTKKGVRIQADQLGAVLEAIKTARS